MSRQEKMFLSSCFEKIQKGKNTPFLNPMQCKLLESKCKKHHIFYQVFRPFESSEKMILYVDQIGVTCYQISAKEVLTHPQILGSLFSHQMKNETFGDIVIQEDASYIYILDTVISYFEQYFTKVGKMPVSLKKVDIDVLNDYEPKKIEKVYFLSSLRFDVLVAALTGYSRKKVNELFMNQYVIYQYQVVSKGAFEVEVPSTFSIRKFGKYQIKSWDGKSKSGKYIVTISKYI